MAKIDDDICYNKLYEALTSALGLPGTSKTKWDTKRRKFLNNIEPLLAKVGGPTLIPAEKYDEKCVELKEAQVELDAAEDEIDRLKGRLTATEALKDKNEVKALAVESGDIDTTERFEALLLPIAKFRKHCGGAEVFNFILSRSYRKPYTVHQDDMSAFEQAMRNGLIKETAGGDLAPNWDKPILSDLEMSLNNVGAFVGEHRDVLETEMKGAPLDCEFEDFWNHHYR